MIAHSKDYNFADVIRPSVKKEVNEIIDQNFPVEISEDDRRVMWKTLGGIWSSVKDCQGRLTEDEIVHMQKSFCIGYIISVGLESEK